MACGNLTAVCGWEELINGSLISASFNMFNDVFFGWFIIILFFVYEIMLYSKTRNLTLVWIIGILFTSLYAVSSFRIDESFHILGIILVFELAGIIYLIMKK